MNNLVSPFPLSFFSSLLSRCCYKDRRRRGEKGAKRKGLDRRSRRERETRRGWKMKRKRREVR